MCTSATEKSPYLCGRYCLYYFMTKLGVPSLGLYRHIFAGDKVKTGEDQPLRKISMCLAYQGNRAHRKFFISEFITSYELYDVILQEMQLYENLKKNFIVN